MNFRWPKLPTAWFSLVFWLLGVASSHGQSVQLSTTATGYTPGSNGTFDLTVTVTYTGTAPATLGLEIQLPAGWSYKSDTSPVALTSPVANTESVLEWAYYPSPAASFSFVLTLNQPATASGDQIFSGRFFPGGFNQQSIPALTITSALTPLQSWRQQYLGQIAGTGDAADTADPDADGTPNLLEYALGSLPANPVSNSRAAVSIAGARLQISFFRARSDVAYLIEASSDLVTWNALATDPGTVGQNVTVTDTTDLGTAVDQNRFLRLKVTQR